jgi:hypothetical protein
MRIKMITLASGPAGIYEPNRIYTAPAQLSVELAQAFVACGAAVSVDKAPKTATAPSAPERAVRPKAVRR